MKLFPTIVALLALGSTATFAADEKPKGEKGEKGEGKPKADPAEMFKKLDSNGDGSISLDEYKAGPAGKKDATKAEESFKKHDKDGDGKLSLEEFSPAKKEGKKAAK
jgi:Ca2+-binding EF-hand superfamily protein